MRKAINSRRLKEIGEEGVLAMICDSTNVFSAGRSGSELDVRKSMLNIMSRLKKRIIITSFASNVARMESAFYCAEKTGRQISLVGRSMHRIYKAARQCGYLKNTIEPIDPVRYISNNSSGKQGYAIADSLAKHGAQTTLISGPSFEEVPQGVNLIKVKTAMEMLEVIKSKSPADIGVFTAAVVDWKVKEYHKNKIKKNGKNSKLDLVENISVIQGVVNNLSLIHI